MFKSDILDKSIAKLFFKVLLKLKSAFLDLLPIVLVVTFFQLVVLQQPFPNLGDIIVGLVLVVLGLMFFIEGLEIGLFPIGENLSMHLPKKAALFGCFCLHFYWVFLPLWQSLHL
jgi:hypothetical protein